MFVRSCIPQTRTRESSRESLSESNRQIWSTSTHPILGDELRALRRLQREQEPRSPFVFTSERGAPFSTAGFARMIERAGAEAKLGFKAHPHMLRHACGYALPNKGTSVTKISSIQSGTPNSRPRASKTSGAPKSHPRGVNRPTPGRTLPATSQISSYSPGITRADQPAPARDTSVYSRRVTRADQSAPA